MPFWPALQPFARPFFLPSQRMNLFLYEAGSPDAPPVLLVHGLGDEADTWRHILPGLSEQYRVIAPDLPGFGRSDRPGLAYTPAFFRDVLHELLDTLDIMQVMLVGHSLGATLAHSISLDYPGRVSRLALLSGSLLARNQKLDPATLLYLVPGLGEWLYTRLRKDPQEAYRSLEPYYYSLENLPKADRDFLFERVNQRVWNDGQRRAFLSTLRNMARWLPAQQRGLPARLAGLQTPTLVLWGEADRVNSMQGGLALVESQPSANLVSVPGAGHNLHQEKPQEVLQAIRSNFSG